MLTDDTTTVDAASLVRMSPAALDALFRASPAGEIPSGRGSGHAIALRGPGRALFSRVVRRTAWQGKDVMATAAGGYELRNLLSPFGVRAIRAVVREGTSWVDDRPCIVLDYSKTSWLARWVRDEIREVGPGVFLGVVFLRRRRIPLMFALRFGDE